MTHVSLYLFHLSVSRIRLSDETESKCCIRRDYVHRLCMRMLSDINVHAKELVRDVTNLELVTTILSKWRLYKPTSSCNANYQINSQASKACIEVLIFPSFMNRLLF